MMVAGQKSGVLLVVLLIKCRMLMAILLKAIVSGGNYSYYDLFD